LLSLQRRFVSSKWQTSSQLLGMTDQKTNRKYAGAEQQARVACNDDTRVQIVSVTLLAADRLQTSVTDSPTKFATTHTYTALFANLLYAALNLLIIADFAVLHKPYRFLPFSFSRGGFREGRAGSSPPLWATDWRRHSRSCYIADAFDRFTVKHGTQNIQNDCYQQLSDSIRVHKIRFRPGFRPGSTGVAYSAPQTS